MSDAACSATTKKGRLKAMPNPIRYNALPLPFSRPLAGQDAAALPLPFVRPLWQGEDAPAPPQPPRNRYTPVASAFAFQSAAAAGAGICRSSRALGLRTQSDYTLVTTEALPLAACFRQSVAGMPPLYRCAVQTASTQQSLAACTNPQTAATAALRRCNTSPTSGGRALTGCARAVQTAIVRAHRCAVQTASAQHSLCRNAWPPAPPRATPRPRPFPANGTTLPFRPSRSLIPISAENARRPTACRCLLSTSAPPTTPTTFRCPLPAAPVRPFLF